MVRGVVRPTARASRRGTGRRRAGVRRHPGSQALFCDLLAQAPLNLERNVSVESVRSFKIATLDEVGCIGAELRRLLGVDETQAVDVIATATSLAGALWQMATPGPHIQTLYRSDPRLAHAVVEVEPRLNRVLGALLRGIADG